MKAHKRLIASLNSLPVEKREQFAGNLVYTFWQVGNRTERAVGLNHKGLVPIADPSWFVAAMSGRHAAVTVNTPFARTAVYTF